MNKISKQKFDIERSLYNIKNTEIIDCQFEGPNDGESVLKECRDIVVNNCDFSLRYPLWHARGFKLLNSSMDNLTRAPIWYSYDGVIENTKIGGIKAIRECNNIKVDNCEIDSPEFGWLSNNLDIKNSSIVSEYLFFHSNNVNIAHLTMSGKYSFQYMKNLRIKNSILNTKDAFWHSEDIIIENSEVNGEYLGWFSKNLTFIRCKIKGTQPLCYCQNLRMIDCTMEDCDLSFEYSDVIADIKGNITSVKNLKSGIVIADEIGEIINDDAIMPCNGKVEIRK